MSEADANFDKIINEKLGFGSNEERLRWNLELRDMFIVEKGLWQEFVEHITRAPNPKQSKG